MAKKNEHSKNGEYDKEFLLGALGRMLNIRRFEEMSAQMYGLKKIGGFCHLYNGQEAVAVGSIAALDLKKDYVLTAYRDHAHALACGMDPKAAMAELYGKATGCSRGKGGSMHLFDVENHMLGGNGIVGAQIPVATGVALAQAYRKDGGVTLVYFGDGAIHQGSFHESLNLARVWNLPIVYIVENNQFGMGTAVHRVSAVENFEVKAKAYDIPGIAIDGMDFVTVYEGVSAAVEKARSEGLPHLLHIKTYRYRGHSMSDPAKYRTKEQVDEYKAQDPILMLKSRMLEAKQLTDKEFDELDKKAKALAKEAADFAESSEEPSLDSMYEDIYA
ncbi:MAG: pyruvate dehydrogenase (acetyl-transferring) E1 component subunit alpha [Spirochaetaceae bacterium]|nr:MAG: pyruvate dehydrogenase (acetyl-transferring) E1 component subunit alpha [Spirochaetaceae bacterium]